MSEHKSVTKSDPIMDIFSKYKKAVASILPSHMTPEKMLRVAYEMVHRNNKLRQCNPISIINGVIEGSILGLTFGRTCHLIPFGKEAVFDPDYTGLMELGYRSGKVVMWEGDAVFQNDDFRHNRADGTIHHERKLGADRGELIGAYSAVTMDNGMRSYKVIDKFEAMNAKKKSAGAKSDSSPWNTENEWQMWVKTAVRLHSKFLPSSPEMQRATHLSDLAAAGLKQDLGHIAEDAIEAEFKTVEQEPSQKDALKEKLDKLKNGSQPAKDEPQEDLGIIGEAQTDDVPPPWYVRENWMNLRTKGLKVFNEKNLHRLQEMPFDLLAEYDAKVRKYLGEKITEEKPVGESKEALQAILMDFYDPDYKDFLAKKNMGADIGTHSQSSLKWLVNSMRQMHPGREP